MALMVAEFVIFPTATLALTVITALIASWTADGLGGDGRHSDLNTVVRRNLAWGVIPAAIALASPWRPPIAAFLPYVVVLWTVIASTRLAFRYRRIQTSQARRLTQSAVWLMGAGLTTTAIIFVASLFGLTGA
jgi:hypothetical protein